MHFFSSAIFLFSLLSLSVLEASAASDCTRLPYALFTPLSKHKPAQSFCTSKYPLPRPTCLVTTTIPSTTTKLVTTSIAPVTNTITVTTIEQTTLLATDTITPTPTTVTEIHTETTTTTACPAAVLKKRTSSEDKLAPIFTSLQKQAASFVKTLCSCIETTPGCSTSTITSRPTVPITRTSTITYVPTVTAIVTQTLVINTRTTITLDQVVATTTTTTTTTSTSSFCAPPPAQITCPGGTRPDICSPSFFCDSASTCICLATTEGTAVGCTDVNIIPSNCSDTVPCSSSAQCGADQKCVTNLCCNSGQCITINTSTCANGQAVSRLFRFVHRGERKTGGNFP
ncbi:hypothetical protein AA0119_g11563 [Alternaria tenuissima]|uniref:Extracellular membrane protein CFEM domain-containing protein n=1 Tax=Alternaria tenuissima TaxID=119927 RepID=A0AB37W3C5_9PLEO|nr:hypothetical protein B0T12DRAFT_477718 [Alternaria alternata]RYN16242.1 hypothetical protein AA0115_g12463 [Alternaria tenuissima]RYN89201.1 hypothetical protein AA0119_g11563 [Alternaria tenuissima]RYO05793.1 hypothetical protein AA0121_g12386 [Alternaria tenuissima]